MIMINLSSFKIALESYGSELWHGCDTCCLDISPHRGLCSCLCSPAISSSWSDTSQLPRAWFWCFLAHSCGGILLDQDHEWASQHAVGHPCLRGVKNKNCMQTARDIASKSSPPSILTMGGVGFTELLLKELGEIENGPVPPFSNHPSAEVLQCCLYVAAFKKSKERQQEMRT